MVVYGGNKLLIFDGGAHSEKIAEFPMESRISYHNSAFMPVSPYRVQLTQNAIEDDLIHRYFIICAGEGGGLTIIESEPDNNFSVFQNLQDNEEEAQLLSSSVYHYCDSSFNWVINYWNGTCKVKKYIWDKILHEYSFNDELVFTNNEIIDFQTKRTPGPLRLALLDRVLVIDPVTLQEITHYDIRVDKFEHIFAHIKDEHAIFNFETENTYTNIDIITMATGGDYDWDNDRVYFSGYRDNELEPGFRVINYKPFDPNPFFSYSLDGAMEVKYNSSGEVLTGEGRVVAVGDNQIIGFGDDGKKNCPSEEELSELACHYGYRIAFDNHPGFSLPYVGRIGITVACLIDGLLVQREGYSCNTPPPTKIVETGISSSLTCIDENENLTYFFYNGDGGSNIYAQYDETSDETTFIPFGEDYSFSAIDCIYNKESDLILASLQTNCDDYSSLLQIGNEDPILTGEFYNDAYHFTNFNEYIFFYVKNEPDDHYSIYRVWQENSVIYSINKTIDFAVNAIDINKQTGDIYAVCNNLVLEIDKDLVNVQSHAILGNDPVDISYLEGLDKIYIAIYNIPQNNCGRIEVYDNEFASLSQINIINGYPKKIEYNPYHKEAYIISDYVEDTGEEPGFTKISVINCLNDQVIKEKLIRRSDGYIYDTINDQLYFHTNYPDVNANGDLEFNIKALNGFTNEFSNQVNTELYTYSDIFLSKNRAVPSKPSYNYEDNYIYVGNYGSASASKIKAYDETFSFKSGWNWVSFPRLERYSDENFNTVELLSRLSPFITEELILEYQIPNIPPEFIYKTWYPDFFWQGDLDDIQSSSGYKLTLDNTSSIYSLRLEGAKADYGITTDLAIGENWLGYFLDVSQFPEQCLPENIWNALVQIKTQYWSMTKINSDPPYWFLQGKKKPFKYGDLVILKTDHSYPGFHWVNNSPGGGDSEML
ncbi:MAG: hypothetical protein FJY07_09680, partial [Bacteroidetes bacterium]|nr:hypothetical protein [Bacteroidota bacterium]